MRGVDGALLAVLLVALGWWWLGGDDPDTARMAAPPASLPTDVNPMAAMAERSATPIPSGGGWGNTAPRPTRPGDAAAPPRNRSDSPDRSDLLNRQAAAAEAGAAGWEALQAGRPADAVPHLETAMAGGVLGASYALALAYQRLDRNDDALLLAHQATAEAPDRPQPWQLLGQLFADRDDPAAAADAWRRALTLAPNPQLAEVLRRLEGDQVTDARYFVGETRHFRIRFEGPAEAYLAERILDQLEAAYARVGLALGIYPDQATDVTLYTRQTFFDVTRSPAWAGGIYDGRIRLPISGADQDPAALERVVAHEYVHAALAHLLGSQAIPTWLHEGVALGFEPRSLGPWAEGVWGNGPRIPLRAMAGSLTGLSRGQAERAYAQSYLLVRHLRDRFGDFKLADLLQGLVDTSVVDTFQRTYGETPEQLMTAALAGQHG